MSFKEITGRTALYLYLTNEPHKMLRSSKIIILLIGGCCLVFSSCFQKRTSHDKSETPTQEMTSAKQEKNRKENYVALGESG
jgi:hypothetical protein